MPLACSFPLLHGGDAVARLAHSDRLILAYQLPLPQALVFVCRALWPDPLLARLAFCLAGSLVAVALSRVMGRSALPGAAWPAGVLAALHPALVHYSTLPYQEPLMLALLLFAADALAQRHEGKASLLLGAACLCRYEAWMAAGLYVVAGPGRWPRRVALACWAPLLWIAFWRGLSPAGTYVLDLSGAAPLRRLVFLALKLHEYSGGALLALAAAGAALAVANRQRAAGLAALLAAAILAAAAGLGHEFPRGSGLVTERMVHVPALLACALAGLALGRTPRWLMAPVLLAHAVAWTGSARELAAAAAADPDLRLAAGVAAVAARQLGPGECLAVEGPELPPAALDDYVTRVARSGGDEARARRLAQDLARRPPDADRVAAHLARPPGAVRGVREAGAAACPLLAAFDAPEEPGALARLAEGSRRAVVLRR